MRQWIPRTGGEQRFKSMIESLEERYAPWIPLAEFGTEDGDTDPGVEAQTSQSQSQSQSHEAEATAASGSSSRVATDDAAAAALRTLTLTLTTAPPGKAGDAQSAASSVGGTAAEEAAVPASPESDVESVTGKRRRNKTGPRGKNKKFRVTSNKHAVHGNEVRITIPPVFVGCFSDDVLPVAQRFFEEALPTLMAAIASSTIDLKSGCKDRLAKHAEYARAKADYDAKMKEMEEWKAKEEARLRELASFFVFSSS